MLSGSALEKQSPRLKNCNKKILDFILWLKFSIVTFSPGWKLNNEV